MNIKNRKYFQFAIRIILLSLSICIINFAQSTTQDKNSDKVNEMTQKLANKLLLSDKQETSIKIILTDYFEGVQNIVGDGNKKESLKQEAESKIVNLLDNKQKMKFSIIKNEWWDQAN